MQFKNKEPGNINFRKKERKKEGRKEGGREGGMGMVKLNEKTYCIYYLQLAATSILSIVALLFL